MLADLRVFQISAKQEDLFLSLCVKLRGTPYFSVSTCLRHLVICMHATSIENHAFDQNISPFAGEEAYLFLLRVAAGLESRIVGETEILSQLRDAWQRFDIQPAAKQLLRPYVDKIFQDAKMIRSQFLQGLGGSSSYASAVRKLIQPSTEDSLFIVGAGQLAEQMLTFFNAHRLLVWNRNAARAQALVEQLTKNQNFRNGLYLIPHELMPRALFECNHLILCTPTDEGRERHWLGELARQRAEQVQPVLKSVTHLGGENLNLKHWEWFAEKCFDLNEIFSLQRQSDDLRAHAITLAEAACRERAQARFLADGISLVHGWDDLAFR